MYMPKVDFCSVCGSFDAGSKISGKFVCYDCQKKGQLVKPKVEPIEKAVKVKVKKEPKNKKLNIPEHLKIPKKFVRKTTRVVKKYKTKAEIILEFLNSDPQRVYKSLELYDVPSIAGKCKNQRSIANALRELLINEKIFGKDIYKNGRKIYKVIALSQELIDSYEVVKSRDLILKIIRENSPVETKIFSQLTEHSEENALRLIRKELRSVIETWKCGTKYVHIIAGDVSKREQIQKMYPKATQVIDSGG